MGFGSPTQHTAHILMVQQMPPRHIPRSERVCLPHMGESLCATRVASGLDLMATWIGPEIITPHLFIDFRQIFSMVYDTPAHKVIYLSIREYK